MNKKICYVVTVPLTIRAFFIPQIKYLAAHGFDVSVVCSSDSSLQDELGDSASVHYIDMPRGISVAGSVSSIIKLARFFKKEKFDFIQYSTPNAALYASIASKIAGCKIRNYHLMGFRFLGAGGVKRLFLKSLEKAACSLSTSVECVSKSNLNFGVSQGIFARDKATVVWNGSSGGVDLKRFNIDFRDEWRAEIRQQLGFGDDDFVFGFVGRIRQDKGINELLKAFFLFEGDARLFIIGDYEDEGAIDSALWEKALSDERVVVHQAETEIEKYFAMIDVLVLPSYREGFGNVVTEAAAMGTPAIVSDIPGPIDCIIEGQTAFKAEAGNADSLLNSMNKIAAADYKIMGRNAFEYISSSFDSEKLCVKIYERKLMLLNNDENK